jgi:hypothetical protein
MGERRPAPQKPPESFRAWGCGSCDAVGSTGSSTIDLLTTIKQIADKVCLFKSLADPWCDTTTPGGRLMLTVLGGLAEFERELIKARTSEGRERAKRAGIRMGRKPKPSPHQKAEVRDRKANGDSVRLLARSYGSAPTQFREFDDGKVFSTTRTPLCLIALWPLSRCRVYKTCEILSVTWIGVRIGSGSARTRHRI